ncbi:UNVERIFIED_CONTAM: hypothetical protein GTU68_008821 [Idotea baltica]|nr:hypothetical protein [Idotea baltica]
MVGPKLLKKLVVNMNVKPLLVRLIEMLIKNWLPSTVCVT